MSVLVRRQQAVTLSKGFAFLIIGLVVVALGGYLATGRSREVPDDSAGLTDEEAEPSDDFAERQNLALRLLRKGDWESACSILYFECSEVSASPLEVSCTNEPSPHRDRMKSSVVWGTLCSKFIAADEADREAVAYEAEERRNRQLDCYERYDDLTMGRRSADDQEKLWMGNANDVKALCTSSGGGMVTASGSREPAEVVSDVCADRAKRIFITSCLGGF
jgi:hypothetical protein